MSYLQPTLVEVPSPLFETAPTREHKETFATLEPLAFNRLFNTLALVHPGKTDQPSQKTRPGLQ